MNAASLRRLRRARSKLSQWLRKQRRGKLVALEHSFHRLFPAGARLRRVATGCRFTEGPVWMPEHDSLFFTDIPANRIFALESGNKLRIFREPSGHANGLARDAAGRLVTCEHSTRRVTRTELDGSVTVLADRFNNMPLNSPNDVVVSRSGAIYFTDPTYGIKPGMQEQPVQGVYRLSPQEGTLALVADDFIGPNGLAFSPDETRLYVDDSSAHRHIRVFDVLADGSLANDRVFHDMRGRGPGSPDGMKVDEEGNVYCTGAGGVWVFDQTGRLLGIIGTPEQPSNCAWGDADRKTLYITAQSSVYKVSVALRGSGLF